MQKLIRNGEIQKTPRCTQIHSPGLGLVLCCVSEHLSECPEAAEVGLEGPPKSPSLSAAAVDEYKRAHSRGRDSSAVRLFSESSSSSDWNYQANLQGSVYFSRCEGNYFRFSSETAFVKGTLRSSHSLGKPIHRITSLPFCFWSHSSCLVMIHPRRRK